MTAELSDHRNARSRAETTALRLLRDGMSLRQVQQETGLSEAVLKALVHDFPSSTVRAQPVAGDLPISALIANPANIRTDLGDIDGLAETIVQHGILQPLLVSKTEAGPYVLLDGHRRLAAAHKAGLEKVPVRLHAIVDDEDATVLMLVTGLQKADLHPLDEADAYRRLHNGGMSQKDIAALVGKSIPHVSQRTALSYLTEPERAALRAKEIGVTEAYKIGRTRSARAITVEQKRDKPRRVPHFTPAHPLAPAAGFLCNRAGHQITLRLGVACGSCWEAAIGEHAVQTFLSDEQDTAVRREALAELDLSQAPPPVLSGPSAADTDAVAIDLACDGARDMNRLTKAERRAVIARLHAEGLDDQQIARRTGCASRTALRIRRELNLPAITPDSPLPPLTRQGGRTPS